MKFYAFDGSVYMFSREEFAKAWLKDKKTIQKIGVSRQTAFQWCRGDAFPTEERAGLVREIAPDALKFVGRVPT
jgi:predicted DNA-binding transcriptional regulator AlpA